MRVAAVLLSLMLVGVAAAQEANQPSSLAIRFQLNDNAASFVPILGSRGALGFTASPWQTKDHKYSTLVSLINLSAQQRGDQWQLEVSVTLPNQETRVLASSLVNVDEPIKVEKLTEYELFPSEVAIVRINGVVAAAPEIVNRAKSIAVEVNTPKLVPSPYTLTLTNESGKEVYGILIVCNQGSPGRSEAWLKGHFGQRLIEGRAKYTVSIPSARDGGYQRIGPNVYRPSQSNRLEVTTVIFTDGSYEGEPRYAAILTAEIIGARSQVSRLIALLERAIATKDSDEAVLATLKESLSTLDTEVQSADAEELSARLAGMNQTVINDAVRWISWGRSEVNADLTRDLINRDAGVDLRVWLAAEKNRLENWNQLLK
jgi:hypothetical protein